MRAGTLKPGKTPLRLRRRGKTEFLAAQPLARFPWLVHAFTTRRAGPRARRTPAGVRGFNLSYGVGDDRRRVSGRRRRLLRALGAARMQLLTLRQRHTDIVQGIHARPRSGRREPDGTIRLAGDGLVTDRPGLLLAVQVADCFPLLLVDPRRRVVASVHAGWRGTLRRIAEKAVGRMVQEFGSDPGDLRAVLGPGIRRCCYQVGREVAEAFQGRFPDWEDLLRRREPSPSEVHWQQPLFSPEKGRPRPRPAVTSPDREKYHLDLEEANRRQLLSAGLRRGNIWVSGFCTACRSDTFFSHRAEGGRTGRMMGVVGVRWSRPRRAQGRGRRPDGIERLASRSRARRDRGREPARRFL